MNLPNQLTVARFIMALIFVALMSFSNVVAHLVAYAVFTAATITDYYDGKIARSRNLITNFGKLLDPVADKVLLVGALVMLMRIEPLYLPAWTVVVIIAREFLVTGVRSLAASEGRVIAAEFWGKTKAVIQMVYVFVFLGFVIVGELIRPLAGWGAAWQNAVDVHFPRVLEISSCAAIVGVAVFTIYSGVHFMQANWAVVDFRK